MKRHCSAGKPASRPRTETLRLADLVDHPDQSKYFRGYGGYEREALKADIAAHGLKTAIEVLPPGNAAGLAGHTILAGHTRRAILVELGHTETEARVRYDLTAAPRAEVDKVFLADNVARRQMDRLGQARAAVRLYVIERELKGRRVYGDPLQQGELRDRIGKIIDMSGRNLVRYLAVLRAPAEVQDAFAAGRVRLVDAARVAGLPAKDRDRLAARLRAAEDPKAVFAAYFPPPSRRHVKPADAVAAFARALAAGHADLEGRVGAAPRGTVRRFEATLRKGRAVIDELLEKLAAAG